MSEPGWLAADLGAASDVSPRGRADRMRHSPQNAHSKEDDGKDLLTRLLPPRQPDTVSPGAASVLF